MIGRSPPGSAFDGPAPNVRVPRGATLSYTVDLELDQLRCRSKAAAHQAAAVINTDTWMRHHIEVSVVSRSFPGGDAAWELVIETYDGCYWNEPSARRVWLAIAPFMADHSTLEFRHEEGHRFRIRWEAGRVYEEFPKEVIWALECEITPALLEP